MSELHAHGRPQGNSLFWRAYMLSWTVLAGGALAYLGLFALHPENQGSLGNAPPQSNQESNRAELDRAQLSAQVRSLNETVAILRSDIARIRNSDPSQTANTPPKAVSVRPVATREITVDSNPITTASMPKTDEIAPAAKTPVVQPAPVQTTAAAPPQKRAKGPNRATTPLEPGGLPPLPKAKNQQTASIEQPPGTSLQPLILNGQQASPISTGSIVAPVKAAPTPTKPVEPAVASAPSSQLPTFGQPTVKPEKVVSAAAALSLSTATSVTGLRASWLLLTTRHRDAFIGYTPRYIANPATGTYQLLAGPIANRSEADRMCTELRNQSVNCGVTDYVGSPL